LDDDDDEDLEPQAVDVATNASLMSQVANHILGSFGSWEGNNICGTTSSIYDGKVPMPVAEPSEYTQDTEIGGIEWEGQEVQLVSADDRRDEMQRMPPPPPAPHRRGRDNSYMGSVGFSSLGSSCHSWLPEQMAAASSYFSGREDPDQIMMEDMGEDSVAMGNSVTYTVENYSVNGEESLGGGSLAHVFDVQRNHHPTSSMHSPTQMSHRELQQIPSWERSVRSRSPMSFPGGGDEDDASFLSKTSSKGALSSAPSMGGDEMAWTRE
jgi:hypothetical protein